MKQLYPIFGNEKIPGKGKRLPTEIANTCAHQTTNFPLVIAIAETWNFSGDPLTVFIRIAENRLPGPFVLQYVEIFSPIRPSTILRTFSRKEVGNLLREYARSLPQEMTSFVILNLK